MREKLFKIIETNQDDNRYSNFYDFTMMLVIVVSLIPLSFKETNDVFHIIEIFSTIIFIVDYLLRLITADYKLDIKHPSAFFIYPFTPMALIDLIAIISSFSFFNNGFRVLKIIRLMRTMRVFRAAKFLRYSKSLLIITNVFKKEKKTLSAVATLAVAYIIISALVIFNVEPDSFNTFFDAIYWATVSLTTVGYGDIYPTTTIGRCVTMISSVFGIAIIALPSGIITGGYLNEVQQSSNSDEEKNDLL